MGRPHKFREKEGYNTIYCEYCGMHVLSGGRGHMSPEEKKAAEGCPCNPEPSVPTIGTTGWPPPMVKYGESND